MHSLKSCQFGPFLIDPDERILRRDGTPVPLTPKAFDVLAALLDKPGHLISKEELLQKVWPDTFVEESNLAYNVFALRKALGDTADDSRYIETVPKKGYRFKASVMPANQSGSSQRAPESDAAPGRARFTGQSRNLASSVVRFPQAPMRSQLATERRSAPYSPTVEPLAVGGSDLSRRRWSRWYWLWFAGATVLVAAGVSVLQWRRAPADATPPRALPLTALPGIVRGPSLSPDGTYVVFSWNGPQRDNTDLYVQQIGVTAPPYRLTSDPANDYSPSWSPDGRTIAFLRRGPDGTSAVLRIAPLGGPERKVAEIQPRLASFRPVTIAWCPDSSCLLVTDTLGADQPDGLIRIAVETGERRQLTDPRGLVRDADPAISPDGRSLIFRRDTTPGSGEFYRVSLSDAGDAAGDPVRLTSTLNAGKPVWIPDSREILFSGRGGLWILDAFAGGTPRRLPFVGQDGANAVLSRLPGGGRRLVYARSFGDTNVWRVDTARPGAPAASPPGPAISSTRGDLTPILTPDGRRAVFLSDRSGELEFWVGDPDGSNAFQLTSMAITPGYPRWSPDLATIAFHGDPEGRPDVLVVPAGGGLPRNLTKDLPASAYPSFSRDGRWIYFAAGLERGESRIWKMAATGGTAVQVTNNTGTVAIESYDGDLYYVDNTNGPGTVWRLPRSGGPAVKTVDGVVLGNFDVVESGLYYIDRVSGDAGSFSHRPDGETRLRYFDFGTSQSTTVATNLGTIGLGLTATRDGRTIFFTRLDSSTDELMLVDNFR